MDTTRAQAVGDAIAAIEYGGLVQIDRASPSYAALARLAEAFERESASLLGLCAGTLVAHSSAPERRFWAALERCALASGEPEDTVEAAEILERFVDRPVNDGLPAASRDDLVALFEERFANWFVDEYLDAGPVTVWNRLADALDDERHASPVVRGMDAYDQVTMCVESEYLPLPPDVPPPSDDAVARLTVAAGLLDPAPDAAALRAAWRDISGFLAGHLGRRVSVLRLGGVVRQLGTVLGTAPPGTERETLETYLHETADISEENAGRLATELTHTC